MCAAVRAAIGKRSYLEVLDQQVNPTRAAALCLSRLEICVHHAESAPQLCLRAIRTHFWQRMPVCRMLDPGLSTHTHSHKYCLCLIHLRCSPVAIRPSICTAFLQQAGGMYMDRVKVPPVRQQAAHNNNAYPPNPAANYPDPSSPPALREEHEEVLCSILPVATSLAVDCCC